jgi:Right handed beta helix region
MSSSRLAVFVLALCVGLQLFPAKNASAKTWFVERDGTGDFIVIQDAVDAAASGDTLKIGLGRFDEKQLVTTPGWSESVRVQVTQQELTIIGSGPGTIIGQSEPWLPEQGHHKGIATADLWGNQILRVEDLHLENMSDGIYTSHEDKVWNLLEVRDCSFGGNQYSLALIGGGGTVSVSNCDFNNSTTEGVFIIGWDLTEMEILGCVFRRSMHVYSTSGISLNRVQNALIEDCEIYEGSTGITVNFGGPTKIKNCLFDDQGVDALFTTSYCDVSIVGCTFRNQGAVLETNSWYNQIEMIDSVIEDVENYSFYISSTGSFSVHNCDLAKGDQGVILVNEFSNCLMTKHLDMTNNYWGTDNPDSIQAWIHDRNDTDRACFWIDYEPFLSETTPTETQSLGGFKAMFR